MTQSNHKSMKLFARNMTARASTIVRGNPVTSRLEDGVENCYPGLEFDQRNLDKVFFPGLTFEWHHERGTIVREYDPKGPAKGLIEDSDIRNGLYLVAVKGMFASRQEGREPAMVVRFLSSPAGLNGWRVVRDLEPGPVSLLLASGEVAPQNPQVLNRIRMGTVWHLAQAAQDRQSEDDVIRLGSSRTMERLNQATLNGQTEDSIIQLLSAETRSSVVWVTEQRELSIEQLLYLPNSEKIDLTNGLGKLVVLVGNRAKFLTDQGVIDPTLVFPGDLTRSLCSPWQYDFADCGCFYWAANKPDLVSSESQTEQVLNFQRRRRELGDDEAARAEDWLTLYRGGWDAGGLAMRHAEMMSRWSELPFVVDGRETDVYEPVTPSSAPTLLDRNTIISRLQNLAKVEHALAIEYLYAHYSLKADPPNPFGLSSSADPVSAAAQELFLVAIDEMRHMRSVNEILHELGQPAVLERALIIGEDFDQTGRSFEHPFTMKPLTPDRLNWFIDVERASPNMEEGGENSIDGMYTLILRSIEQSNQFDDAKKRRISHLIKVIIDEGTDHFERFSRAQKVLGWDRPVALDDQGLETYLRYGEPRRLSKDDPNRDLQDLCDAAYVFVLDSLEYVFKLGDEQRGKMMEAARRAMFNMDDAARLLAGRGQTPMFDMTGWSKGIRPAAEPVVVLDSARRKQLVAEAGHLTDRLEPFIAKLEDGEDPGLREAAQRIRARSAEMTRDFVSAANLET